MLSLLGYLHRQPISCRALLRHLRQMFFKPFYLQRQTHLLEPLGHIEELDHLDELGHLEALVCTNRHDPEAVPPTMLASESTNRRAPEAVPPTAGAKEARSLSLSSSDVEAPGLDRH